jgi:hypothetical protein
MGGFDRQYLKSNRGINKPAPLDIGTTRHDIMRDLSKAISAMDDSIARRLEQYTVKRPQEVLIVQAEIEGEPDEIAIFKGFSSSLTRSTAFDPDVPVLPEEAKIVSIDRVASPYNPDSPRYLQQGLSWETMQFLLSELGI